MVQHIFTNLSNANSRFSGQNIRKIHLTNMYPETIVYFHKINYRIYLYDNNIFTPVFSNGRQFRSDYVLVGRKSWG